MKLRTTKVVTTGVLALSAAVFAGAFAASPARAAEPPPIAAKEIEHLLDYVVSSGCEFYRNGSWYEGKLGQSHLRDKYRYLVGRDMIQAASDFIDKAATRSSFSNHPYQVRCAGAEPIPTSQWFNAELVRFRGAVH